MALDENFVDHIWYFAGFSPEIKAGQLTHKTIAGHQLVLGRSSDGNIFALRDVCPHRAAPLSAGRQIGDSVECPYHGWRFAASDGQCLDIPAQCREHDGKIKGSDATKGIGVRTYRVKTDGHMVWVYLASDGSEPPVHITPPHFDMARIKPLVVVRRILNTHIDQAVIGLIDPAHVSFLHRQWWWRTGKDMRNKEKHFESYPNGWVMTAHTPSANSVGYKLLGGSPITEIIFQLPNVRTEEISIGDKKFLSFTVVTPIDETHTEITQAIFTNFTLIRLLKPIMRQAAKIFLRQDGDMIDLQGANLVHNPRQMLVGDADIQARWYYASKKEWHAAHGENRAYQNPVKTSVLHWRS